MILDETVVFLFFMYVKGVVTIRMIEMATFNLKEGEWGKNKVSTEHPKAVLDLKRNDNRQ